MEIKATEDEVSESFDKKHKLTYKDTSHRYRLDGRPCVSTTTFNKASYPTSMGLINWMKKETAKATFQELATFFALNDRWPDVKERDDIYKTATSAHEDVAQEAADIGTITHSFCELWSNGKEDEANALLDKVRKVEKWPLIQNCTDKFLDWYKQNKGESVLTEALVAYPSSHHAFAGRLDRLDRVGGKLRIRDYKTSKAIFLEQFIQMASYKLALKAWSNLEVQELEIIRLGKEDGVFETLLIDNPIEIQLFTDQALRNRETFEFMKMNDDARFDWRKR